MNNHYVSRGVVAAVALTFAAAVPAMAQQAPASSSSTPAVTTTESTGPSGRLEKYQSGFRASELVGATVFNDHGDTIGKVNDLIMDESGKADHAVISVGGFLGLGTKYVDVSFQQLKLEPSRDAGASGAVTGIATSDVGTGTTSATGRSTGAASGTLATGGSNGVATGAATTTAGNAAIPPHNAANAPAYFSLVMPGATKETLTAMPEFKYGS